MEYIDIFEELILKLLHILFLLLPADEFTPRGEEIFDRGDILAGMSELNSSMKSPPPNGFCR